MNKTWWEILCDLLNRKEINAFWRGVQSTASLQLEEVMKRTNK